MKTNQLTQFSLQLSQFTAWLQQELQLSHLGQIVLERASPQRQRRYQAVGQGLGQGWGQSVGRWLNRSKGWLLCSLGGLLLWVLLWQWLLSLAVGLVVMVGCYLAQQGQLKSWRVWQRLWSRANRALSWSVLAGLAATGSSYLALATWIESDRSWLASGLILEGFGLLAILSLLVWRQFYSPQPQANAQPIDLEQLSDADPLRRLIAVRQLTQLARRSNPPLAATHLSECFRLMLDRELEPLVCNALIEGLQQLNSKQPLEPQAKLRSGATRSHS